MPDDEANTPLKPHPEAPAWDPVTSVVTLVPLMDMSLSTQPAYTTPDDETATSLAPGHSDDVAAVVTVLAVAVFEIIIAMDESRTMCSCKFDKEEEQMKT